MSALVRDPRHVERGSHGRGETQPRDRRSGSGGELQLHDQGRATSDLVRGIQRLADEQRIPTPENPEAKYTENLGKLEAINNALKSRKAKALISAMAKRNLVSAGFRFGWDLGQHLIDEGWLPLPGGTPVGGPEGIVYTGAGTMVFNPSSSCPPPQSGGQYIYHYVTTGYPGLSGTTDCNSPTIGVVSTSVPYEYADVVTAFQNRPDPSTVSAYELNTANRYQWRGNWQGTATYDDTAVAANWQEQLTPGVGVPIAPGQPMERPDLWPGTLPMQMPTPQPWKEASPKDPFEQPSRPRRVTRPGRIVVPLTRQPFPVVAVVPPDVTPDTVLPEPGGVIPDQVLEISASGFRRSSRDNSTDRPTRPKWKEEGKNTVRTVGGKVWVAINMFTEGLDFLEALHSALPDKCKAKGRPTPFEMAQAMYDCWDHLPDDYMQRAIAALVSNQIEDFAYGQLGRAAQSGYRATGQATGINRALRSTQPEDSQLPLPQLHYEDGAWWVTVGDSIITGHGGDPMMG